MKCFVHIDLNVTSKVIRIFLFIFLGHEEEEANVMLMF